MQVFIDGVRYVPAPETDDANDCENALNSLAIYTDYPDETIRHYLARLLTALWTEGECFSGKRPLGNSGWEYRLIASLVECGYISGEAEKDEDGWLADCTYDAAEATSKVAQLIQCCFFGEPSP